MAGFSGMRAPRFLGDHGAMSWLNRIPFFKPSAAPPPAPEPEVLCEPQPVVEAEELPLPPWKEPDGDVIVYPPPKKGLPACSVEELLERYQDPIARIQDAIGCDNSEWRGIMLPVIERFAAYVHLLPASEVHHHRGPGGLLQHSLEVARLSAQWGQRKVFVEPKRPPKDKHHCEPLWVMACAVAGLSHDAGKPGCDLRVANQDGSLKWVAYNGALYPWLRAHGMRRYWLHWTEGRRHNLHMGFTPGALQHIWTDALIEHFARDPAIHPTLIEVLSGVADPASPMASVVLRADRASVNNDLKTSRYDPNALSLGVPVDRYFVDAMRRLAKRGKWTCNVPGARLWHLPDGLHLVWPKAGEDIIEELARMGVPGVPTQYETVADILVDRNHVRHWREEGRTRFFRRMAPVPLMKGNQPTWLRTLLLMSPELVFPGQPPPQIAVHIEHRGIIQPAAEPLVLPSGVSDEDAHLVIEPRRIRDQRERTAEDIEWQDDPDNPHENPPAPLDPSSEDTETQQDTGVDEAGDPGHDPLKPHETQPFEDDGARVSAAPVTPEPTPEPEPEPPREPAPVVADSDAETVLAGRGDGARVVRALALAVRQKRLAIALLRADEDGVLLAYPEAFESLEIDGIGEEPSDKREALWAAALILVDKLAPNRTTLKRHGRNWVRLGPEGSTVLAPLLTAAAEAPPSPPQTERPPPADASAPARPRKPAASTPDSENALATEVLRGIRSGRIPTAQTERGRLISVETLELLSDEYGMHKMRLMAALIRLPSFTTVPEGLLIVEGRKG